MSYGPQSISRTRRKLPPPRWRKSARTTGRWRWPSWIRRATSSTSRRWTTRRSAARSSARTRRARRRGSSDRPRHSRTCWPPAAKGVRVLRIKGAVPVDGGLPIMMGGKVVGAIRTVGRHERAGRSVREGGRRRSQLMCDRADAGRCNPISEGRCDPSFRWLVQGYPADAGWCERVRKVRVRWVPVARFNQRIARSHSRTRTSRTHRTFRTDQNPDRTLRVNSFIARFDTSFGGYPCRTDAIDSTA